MSLYLHKSQRQLVEASSDMKKFFSGDIYTFALYDKQQIENEQNEKNAKNNYEQDLRVLGKSCEKSKIDIDT